MTFSINFNKALVTDTTNKLIFVNNNNTVETPYPLITENLLKEYRLQEKTGDTVTDSSGNNYNLIRGDVGLNFGKPSWDNEGLFYPPGSGIRSCVGSQLQKTYSEITFHFLTKFLGNQGGGFNYFFSGKNNTEIAWSFWADNDPVNGMVLINESLNLGFNNRFFPPFIENDADWHIHSISFSKLNSRIRVYIDGIKYSERTVTPANLVGFSKLFLGSTYNYASTFIGSMAYVSVYSIEQNENEVLNTFLGIKYFAIAIKKISFKAKKNNLVFHLDRAIRFGGSTNVTGRIQAMWNGQVCNSLLNRNCYFYSPNNLASNYLISNASSVSELAAINGLYNSKANKNILMFWHGWNDLASLSAATIYGNLKSFVQQIKTANNWWVVVATLTSRARDSNATQLQRRVDFNTALRDNNFFANGFIDFAANSSLGAANAYLNTNFFRASNIDIMPSFADGGHNLAVQLALPEFNRLLSL